MREMTIEAIRVSLMNYHRVVVLKEKDSNRFLPIWIGAPEADAIAVRQQGVAVPRPMTHDLLSSVISQLGSKILRIVVTEITNETFFARILLEVNGEEVEVDSRPATPSRWRCGRRCRSFARKSCWTRLESSWTRWARWRRPVSETRRRRCGRRSWRGCRRFGTSSMGWTWTTSATNEGLSPVLAGGLGRGRNRVFRRGIYSCSCAGVALLHRITCDSLPKVWQGPWGPQ